MFPLNKMILENAEIFFLFLKTTAWCPCLPVSVFAALVLPAWRMAALQGEEAANVLRGGSDRHRLREALLLLPDLL